MSKTLSFRGQIAHDAVQRIQLATNDGLTGYEITKFQLLGSDLTGVTQESVVKIYSIPQEGAATGVVNFEDNTLLAAGFYEQNASSSYFGDQVVVFDNVKFNQDIFITHDEGGSTAPVNWYIEMRQSKLSLDEQTVATLKNIRNIGAE